MKIDVGATSITVTVDDFRFFEFATTGDFYGYVFSDESGTPCVKAPTGQLVWSSGMV